MTTGFVQENRNKKYERTRTTHAEPYHLSSSRTDRTWPSPNSWSCGRLLGRQLTSLQQLIGSQTCSPRLACLPFFLFLFAFLRLYYLARS